MQVGLVDGEIVLNPTQEQRKKSDLALTVAATMDKIVMIEAGANEVDEDTMLNAIKAAHVEMMVVTFISSIVAEARQSRRSISRSKGPLDMDVFHAIREMSTTSSPAMDTDDKSNHVMPLCCPSWTRSWLVPDLTEADLDLVGYRDAEVRRPPAGCWTREAKRVDGRGITPRSARWPREVGICLVCCYGSGMFTAARPKCSPPAPSAAPGQPAHG